MIGTEPGGGGDQFLRLADRLTRKDPEDDGVGLAELVRDEFMVAHLGHHLRDNAETPGAPFQLALGHLARELARRPEALQGERVRLVLVIDQLEELFTERAITPVARERFVVLLTGLARSGAVWVVATMRSDFWHRVAELPLLAELLSDRSKALDLWPPNPAEIAEIIRGPASKAGIEFGKDDVDLALDAGSRKTRRTSDIGFLRGAVTRDATAGELLATLEGHTDGVLSAAFSPDGRVRPAPPWGWRRSRR